MYIYLYGVAVEVSEPAIRPHTGEKQDHRKPGSVLDSRTLAYRHMIDRVLGDAPATSTEGQTEGETAIRPDACIVGRCSHGFPSFFFFLSTRRQDCIHRQRILLKARDRVLQTHGSSYT